MSSVSRVESKVVLIWPETTFGILKRAFSRRLCVTPSRQPPRGSDTSRDACAPRRAISETSKIGVRTSFFRPLISKIKFSALWPLFSDTKARPVNLIFRVSYLKNEVTIAIFAIADSARRRKLACRTIRDLKNEVGTPASGSQISWVAAQGAFCPRICSSEHRPLPENSLFPAIDDHPVRLCLPPLARRGTLRCVRPSSFPSCGRGSPKGGVALLSVPVRQTSSAKAVDAPSGRKLHNRVENIDEACILAPCTLFSMLSVALQAPGCCYKPYKEWEG